MAAVEDARQRMQGDETELDSWERPWLGRSVELQKQLKLAKDDESYSTGMTVSQGEGQPRRA